VRPRGLTLRIVAACALLVAVLAVVFSVLLSALGDLRGSTSWTEHSVVVLGASGELQNELADYALTTRSYVDDPGAAQLRRWRALRDELSASAGRLYALVRDNPVQSQAAVLLRADIEAFVTDWAEPVISIASGPGGQRRAHALVQQPTGRNLISAIRSEFESFNTHEKALGLKRGSNSRRHAREAAVIAVSTLFALLVAILVSVVIVTRTVILPVRRVGAAAARLGRGELSARVDERGGGEVRDLAQAFNRMAASVRDSRDELESQNRALELQQGALEGALRQLADEKEQVEELRRFIELVSGETDPDRLADTVLTELCDYVGASVGTLFGVDGEHDAALTCLAALGVERAKLPEEILPGEGFAGQAIVARQIVTAGFGEDRLRFESFGHEVTLAQEIHVPLVHGEQAIGVVTLGRAVKEQLSTAELERIRYLAAQAAVGLSHAFALRRARNQAALNRAVLESAYDAFVSFDERGRVMAWNPRAEAIFGWSAMDAIGREIDQLVVPPADRDWYRQRLIEFLRGEDSELLNRHVEVTARHRDGHEFPVEVAISPIELDGSWRFNAFVHDISERRLLEERSGRLFSISLDFMCTFTSDGSFRQINPAWSQILGWDEEELLGTRMLDYVHPDDRERTLAQASKLVEDGELAANFENRWRCADGSYRWLLWSVHYSQEEDLGYAVAKDVTEAKRNELFFRTRLAVSEALAKADTLEQDLAGAVAAAGESLGWEFAAAWLPTDDGSAMRCTAVWGVDGHDVSALRAGSENRELRIGEGIVGRAWEKRAPIRYRDAGELVGDPSYPFARVLHDAGVRSIVAFPLMGEDGVVAVLSLLSPDARDVDDEMLRVLGAIGEQVGHAVYRRLARMEADRMKDEFLALVSHELRTPLTSIVGYLELLDDEEEEEEEEEEELGSEQSRRFLEVIGRNAIRLQRLVDDVLFAARAEAGRLALATRGMDLVDVIAESVAAAAPKAEENGVALHLDAQRTPGMDGDPDRLGQALDNLISNALKFTPPGGRVDVIVRNLGERARVEVRDTGLGMTDDDSRRAFDRFFRAPATRDHAPGVGLGLTIVKTIVEGHDGTIDVTSREGVGTAFVIELPLARARVSTNRA
jgi:PAS domain S-box-containing protein